MLVEIVDSTFTDFQELLVNLNIALNSQTRSKVYCIVRVLEDSLFDYIVMAILHNLPVGFYSYCCITVLRWNSFPRSPLHTLEVGKL